MRLLSALGGVALALASPAYAEESEATKPVALSCEAGPAERYFADVQWYVYACDDGASIVFVTGPKSPPDLSFVFIVAEENGAYTVHGEGNGDRALTKPAYDAITAMSGSDFRGLHAEATAISS